MDSQQLDNDGNKSRPLQIAVVSFDSLGDSLLYLLLAYNLQKNNFDVTYFGNIGYQLSDWFPSLKILPYPEFSAMDEALSGYQLVIMSPPRSVRNRLEADPEYLKYLREKYLLICQKTPVSWVYDHTERLKSLLPPDLFESVKALAKSSGPIRFRHFKDESAVEILCAYMREKMQLSVVSRHVAYTPLQQLKFRYYDKRIIVSPDSAGPEDKNWGKQQFLSLCRQLRNIGYQPVIVVSPANHSEWQMLSQGEFETPLFENISHLASYIYESALLVANDSGNGHLASFLGIPVVTIYKKRNPKFHWRPDWAAGKVVCPILVITFFSYRVWRPFVSTGMVLSAISELLIANNQS